MKPAIITNILNNLTATAQSLFVSRVNTLWPKDDAEGLKNFNNNIGILPGFPPFLAEYTLFCIMSAVEEGKLPIEICRLKPTFDMLFKGMVEGMADAYLKDEEFRKNFNDALSERITKHTEGVEWFEVMALIPILVALSVQEPPMTTEGERDPLMAFLPISDFEA